MKTHFFKTQVRYSETDQMAVVHNSVFYIYMELARVDLVRSEGISYKTLEDTGILMPVLESGCKFKNPARFDDIIEVETHVAYVKNASLRFEYKLRKEDKTLLASGFTVHAAVDRDFCVTTIPDTWREFLLQYVPE
jgi:acyl-CoA thioester hydrolase